MGAWPPGEAPLGKTRGAQPKSLAILAQDCERGARTVSEDRDGAAEGVVAEDVATDGRKPIDALAAINRLGGHKDATLWSEL